MQKSSSGSDEGDFFMTKNNRSLIKVIGVTMSFNLRRILDNLILAKDLQKNLK